MKKLIKPIAYIFSVAFVFGFLVLTVGKNFENFVSEIENRTFDLRQNIIYKYKKHNDSIIILDIDEISYEYFTEKYGSWPVPREYWGTLINRLEKYSPKAIAFDMLFVKKFNTQKGSDTKLISAINNNKNVLVAIDFDEKSSEERTPPEFPDTIKVKVDGGLNLKNAKKLPDLTWKNSRGIMDEILKGNENVGFINVPTESDGAIREYMPLLVYKDEFYRHLALITALKSLGADTHNLKIRNNEIIIDKTHKIPLNQYGMVHLNWYGPERTFEYVPLYKLDRALKTNDKAFLDEIDFKDKIIYIGTSATALGDIKTVPTSSRYPGVETHATFINNVLDNNFIKRTSPATDLAVTILLAALVYLIVFKNASILLSNIEFFLCLAGYFILTVVLMHFFNIWIGLVLPLAVAIGVYAFTYIYKYLLKSKDYEQTYKLAVTDALTEMYNHRYFQEQMIANCENSTRYETAFSLILIDIDLFKKFNDTFGHQSGDAVLKQVAQTIKKSIRATDIACRYGGEEMAVILTNTGKDEAVLTADKICLAIRNNEFILANGQKTNVTISLGVSTAPINGKTPVELIEYADKCLYHAKENGRNQVVANI